MLFQCQTDTLTSHILIIEVKVTLQTTNTMGRLKSISQNEHSICKITMTCNKKHMAKNKTNARVYAYTKEMQNACTSPYLTHHTA